MSFLYIVGEQPLAAAESYIEDAAALLATITQPSLDILPKYQESVTLLSQAERLLAAAHSLKSKLSHGLELSGGEPPASAAATGEGVKVSEVRGELDVSTEVLLEGPELILKDPTSSVTGMALSGMLASQVATQVSIYIIHVVAIFSATLLVAIASSPRLLNLMCSDHCILCHQVPHLEALNA